MVAIGALIIKIGVKYKVVTGRDEIYFLHLFKMRKMSLTTFS